MKTLAAKKIAQKLKQYHQIKKQISVLQIKKDKLEDVIQKIYSKENKAFTDKLILF